MNINDASDAEAKAGQCSGGRVTHQAARECALIQVVFISPRAKLLATVEWIDGL
jgi:hypothetical protein